MNKDLIAYEGQTIPELRADFEAGVESFLAANVYSQTNNAPTF